jgi:hypothetical protein
MPNKEWWLIIARAHHDDWNLYESPRQAVPLSDQNESRTELDAMPMNPIQSDLAEKRISE